ncbi:HAD family hydrolase [Aquibacillus albus]|uniref:Hydrolase of the HAD superfamily n=1 Tax=Aquibacillus albus TaxID=1168171 RepID=A0ABS2MVY0_9BACI|nr:HAD family hydrolase [Aquibacillus albus]MBM7570028.1 putative hydrolase of the HAD superfamily [Aquibacillus albus]
MDTIIFDVDDTLYDQALSFKNTFKKMFQESFSDEELDQLYLASRKHSDALFDKSEAGEISILDMQVHRITAACEEFGIPINYQKAVDFQEAYVAEQKKITLFDEVEELLEALYQENKQLAVLTNGEEKHQSMKIQQLGLARWIPEEHMFISGAIGHAKPKQEAFHIIEEKLQLNKKKTVYIGDSFDNDIVGAKQVGWHAIWMNHRNRNMPESPFKPDKIVYNAKELLDEFRAIGV